jgi:peptide/nickel transport system permease protein
MVETLRKASYFLKGSVVKLGHLPRPVKIQFFFGLGLFLISVFFALFAELIAPYPPLEINPEAIYHPPGLSHLLGTDSLGRDVLSRIIYGTRISFLVAIIATVFSLSVGSLLGVLMGYLGGKIDMLITLPMDALHSLPGFLIALIVTLVLGGGATNIGLAIGIGRIPSYYRTVRSIAISLRDEEFVTAEISLGASTRYIVFRHILPLCISAIVVITTVGIAGSILSIAGLGFLGLGINPPTPEWGSDIAQGRAVILTGIWWPTIGPSIFLFLTVLGFNIFGESLNKVFGGVLEEI